MHYNNWDFANRLAAPAECQGFKLNATGVYAAKGW